MDHLRTPSMIRISLAALLIATQAMAQGATTPPPTPPGAGALSLPNADPFPSTYVPFTSRPTVIRNVTIMTAAGPTIRNGSIVFAGGKISAIYPNPTPPVPIGSDAVTIDGTGKYVTPGIIDVHSH